MIRIRGVAEWKVLDGDRVLVVIEAGTKWTMLHDEQVVAVVDAVGDQVSVDMPDGPLVGGLQVMEHLRRLIGYAMARAHLAHIEAAACSTIAAAG